MFCQNCGAKNNDISIFCENCGAKLEKPVDTAAQQNVQPEQSNVQQPVQPEQSNVQQSVQPEQSNVQQSVQPMKPAKERKPLSKMTIIVAAEAVLFVALVVVFFNIGNKVYGPEKVAEKFFVEVANHNFKEAYKALDVNEDDFINEKNFENASCNVELDKVKDYKIRRIRGNEEEKEVKIQYKTKGSSSTHSYDILLNKKKTKKALFFEDWEIIPESMIVEDFYLDIPEGAEVTVDGVKLGKDYKQKSEDDGFQTYVIPAMFAGEHQVVVTQEGMQEVRKIIDTDIDYGYSLFGMAPSEDVMEEILDTAMEDVKTIYTAASEGKGFEEVADLFSGEEDFQNDAKEDYEDLMSDLTDSSYKTVNRIAFSNLEGTVSKGYVYENSMEAYLEFDYTVDYTEDWFGEVSNESYNSSDVMYLDFVYENGKWKLTGFSGAYLYY